jgi:hypothetical protein
MTLFLIECDETEEERTLEIDESQEKKHSYYSGGVWFCTNTAIVTLGNDVTIIGIYDKDGILHSDIGEYL